MKKRIIISLFLLVTLLISCETLFMKSDPAGDTEKIARYETINLGDTDGKETDLQPEPANASSYNSSMQSIEPEEKFIGTWIYTDKNYTRRSLSVFNDYNWSSGSQVWLSFTFMQDGLGVKETLITYKGTVMVEREEFVWSLESGSTNFVRAVVIDNSADKYRFKYESSSMLSINEMVIGSFYFVKQRED